MQKRHSTKFAGDTRELCGITFTEAAMYSKGKKNEKSVKYMVFPLEMF